MLSKWSNVQNVSLVRLKPLTVNNTEIKLTGQLLIINNRLHSKHDMATFDIGTLLSL